MRMISDFQNVQASNGGGYFDLPAGTYVIRIMQAQDVTPGGTFSPYLSVIYDVAEGQYAGRMSSKPGFAHEIKVYHSAKSQGQFKAFVDAVNASNPQLPPMFTDDPASWDETQLAERVVGVTFKQRWYVGRDGTVKTQLRFTSFHSAEDARTKEFPVPPIEKDSEVGDLNPGDNVGLRRQAQTYQPQPAYQPQQAYQPPQPVQPMYQPQVVYPPQQVQPTQPVQPAYQPQPAYQAMPQQHDPSIPF